MSLAPNSYTYSAYRVLSRAEAFLSADSARVVEPEHILLALLDKPRGLITDTLERCHVSSGAVGAALKASLATGALAAEPGSMFSERAIAALSHAASEAADLENELIDLEHLFLGLLHDEAIAALDSFVQAGFTLPAARAMLLLARTGRF
jgi:ATP-dependent Clp protease ATP-binding subunit ClpA